MGEFLKLRAVWCAFMFAAMTAFGLADQAPYFVYDVNVANSAQAQRLADSSVRLWGENVVIGSNRIAIRKGEELSIALLRLPSRFVGVYQPQIPSTLEDADYRTQWLTYDQLIAEWDGILAAYPWLVTKRTIGVTRENRTIYAYRMYRPESADVLNPPKSMLFLGDTHAREWISPSVVLHIGKMLAQTLATQDNLFTSKIADKVGIWFVPVYNVDGYIFSWTNDRLWRKNRRNNTGSFGVDLNRNYEKGWGGTGSSGTPSSETYRGPSAASEPETQGLRAFSNSLPNLIGFIDFHSYAGDILYPWSYTTSPPPPAAEAIFQSVGNAMKNAIFARAGTTYVVGQGATTLYVASGSSKDWYFDRFGCPSYTIEMAGPSFDPPTSSIAGSQDDLWEGFKAFVTATAP